MDGSTTYSPYSSNIPVDVSSPVSDETALDSDFDLDAAYNGYDNATTTKSNILKDLKTFATEFANDPNHGYLLFSVTIFIIWAVYFILYNSRVQGQILTAVLRRFVKQGEISIGSFSVSPLWGKLMFREIIYVTEDYSIRIVDAVVQFHYWLPYLKKELSEDMSKCEPRLWLELNGPELHIYNRTELYSKLEETFGLDPQLIPKPKPDDAAPVQNLTYWTSWRDLIPVIKIDLNMARFIFGNRLVPSTLVLTVEKAENIYSTKPPSNTQDIFMHVVRSKAENFKVILAPSPKYTRPSDEPPRYMGEGFVVLSSSKIQFYFYMDEPGTVPERPQNVLLDCYDDIAPPVWGLDVKCEKGTNLSYGPWADRQREQLFKFFFPQDYKKLDVVKPKRPGDLREAHQFDMKLSILTEATIDILFSKEKETNAVHMTVQKGSSFEMVLPFVVAKSGYNVQINGQLLYLEASTSLEYRNLLEAESLNYELVVKYPLIWNRHQQWDINFKGVKVSYHFLYAHKEFFHDLIEDWSSSTQPDIFTFVPYTWKFNFNFVQCEVITIANEHNWVDCSSQHHANSHLAFCGDNLDLTFTLPFTDFLPEVIPLKFNIVAKKIYLSVYLPSSYTTRNILAALDRNAKLQGENCRRVFSRETWRKFCKLSSGWVDCWYVPELQLAIGYKFHPCPPLGPSPQANVSTPEKVEQLLSPIRAPKKQKSPSQHCKDFTPSNFDATTMAPDTFSVDLRITTPSEIKLYGTILRLFIHLKENIFGEDQKFADMSEQNPFDKSEIKISSTTDEIIQIEEPDFDGRKYRPFEVTVHIDIRNVRGHLMKDCLDNEPACPTVALDRLVFEMSKQYNETQMQVLLSPVILKASDKTTRHINQSHLQEGFLLLSGFQMRGQAMFSDEGISPWDETLEYAWLVELTVGSISGKLSSPQLQTVVTCLETFVCLAIDSENCLRHPRPYHICYHGNPQPDCPHTLPDHFCPTLDVVKYKMIRTSVDAIDFHLVEEGAGLNLQVFPIRITTCNLHGQHTRSGITAHIQNIRLKNYICSVNGGQSLRDINGLRGEGTSFNSQSTGGLHPISSNASNLAETWVEAASVLLGPVYIDAAISSNILHHDMQIIQHRLLKLHDQKTKRLWFFWPKEVVSLPKEIFGKCGCVGGCSFFGTNDNGPRFFKPSKQDFIDGTNVAIFKLNAPGDSPGYGQSILRKGKLTFDATVYSNLTQNQHEYIILKDKEQVTMSSGYTKAPLRPDKDQQIFVPKQKSSSDNSDNRRMKHLAKETDKIQKSRSKGRIGESNSLGRPLKDTGDSFVTPASISDLRLSDDRKYNGKKMSSSLSLQAELPLATRKSSNGKDTASTAYSSPVEFMDAVQRTVSLGSETMSEAFFSADEDATLTGSKRANSLSPCSSQMSLPTVPECDPSSYFSPRTTTNSEPFTSALSTCLSEELTDADNTLTNEIEAQPRGSTLSISSGDSSTSSISGNSSSSSRLEDYRNGAIGHSQTSLLHSSDSDLSQLNEMRTHSKPRLKKDYFRNISKTSNPSDSESISSPSFISAISSQEELGLVDLHVQLNKPITESPLLMSSYTNHMTQLRCVNWDSPPPTFEKDRRNLSSRQYVPGFDKISEGFTAIRMVGESRGAVHSRSPLIYPSGTPSHPYSWDAPVFTWGNGDSQEELEDIGSGLEDSNTTRTTVVIKLKSDLDIALSPIALEAVERFLEALTPVMETLHPLTIINRASFQSVRSVEGKNTLKKDRYMYWSRLRDRKKSGTPEQGSVVTSTYQESCFLQIQGQITVPRINVAVLQASVVEEIIAFSALDNIKDLTCVSLFSFCLDGVNLQFYSGHQSKKSVQIFMRNPTADNKPKKGKLKTKGSLDILTEPVYIETSEKQQEENMISVSVNNLHVQLRRLKNESSLLNDASITAIPQHRSKVLFNFCRCNRDDLIRNDANDGVEMPECHRFKCSNHNSLEEDRLGFIMFEAGLENVALKAVKRKGYGCTKEDNISNKKDPDGMQHKAHRTTSAPPGSKGKFFAEPVSSGSQTAPVAISTPFYQRKTTVDGKDQSQGAAQSGGTRNSFKEDGQCKNNKKDITSFVIELQTVWLNFAAPPPTPITRKIDFTRLDWNFLSTTSPSINAWMTPADRLTIKVIQFLHGSESRRLGIMASLMAEALDVQSIHVPPKTKNSKLMPLSQTLQEDPSCQLCNVLRSYILQSSLESIESNLMMNNLPKLATLRQGVVVLTRQWKNVLYMPLLMEQTFKYKQAHPAFSYRTSTQTEASISSQSKSSSTIKLHEIITSRNGKDSPLSNIEEKVEPDNKSEKRDDENVVGSSISSNIPPRHSLPSYPPRSSTASAIIPSTKHNDTSPHRFHLPKFGEMLEGTKHFFKGSAHHSTSDIEGPGKLDNAGKVSDPDAGNDISPDREEVKSPNAVLEQWMTDGQSSQGKPTVTFDQEALSIGKTIGYDGDIDSISPPKMQQAILEEPQQAHFLEAHVIFEPLLSAIGVITQQVTGGALEQLGANVAVTGNIDTLRVDIIESESSKEYRKKRKTGLFPGNGFASHSDSIESDTDGKIFLDIEEEVPAFLCEKIILEIDISKVADESRGWVCQQPTLFVSKSAIKQHTSTMVHFSLNIDYIAQQVNMPLLRLLHQISSMYQNARHTQLYLKEQRPTKVTKCNANRGRKESFAEFHDGEFKGAEYSLSLSEEQGTISSLGVPVDSGTLRTQRDSVVSSISARISPPPTGSDSQGALFNKPSRPQSFAQRLRSSTKMGKGYMNLKIEKEKGVHSPLLGMNVSGSGLESATIGSDKSPLLERIDQVQGTPPTASATPKCWRNIYYLVDLYATTPETKTVQQRSVVGDNNDRLKDSDEFKADGLDSGKRINTGHETSILTEELHKSGYMSSERTPVVVFGLAKIQSTKLLATLSGLKLEAEMNGLHSSITYREKVRGARNFRSTSEMSLTGHIGSSKIVLIEGIAPNQQTVVRVTVSKSQGLYSSLSRKSKDKNSALITIGPIHIDIPQHPIILHDMMTRGTKQLSTTLQELRVSRPARLSRGTTFDDVDASSSPRMPPSQSPEPVEVTTTSESLLHPLAIQFSILLQELSINAALLPSLQATYCMQQVSSIGISGSQAKFTVRLPSHHLAFNTKIQDLPNSSTLPPSAKIALPQVHIEAEYLHDDISKNENMTEGMVLREGSYLSAVAEIGSLKHSLTTDLLNHLVFVQKVFMKEVNDVVQKMAGSDKPVPLWGEQGTKGLLVRSQRLLFNVHIKLQGIIITATTPTQSAVRLETETFELQLSNRVQNVGKLSNFTNDLNPKIFGKAQVRIALSLGSLLFNEVFDEAEPEMQQLAYFRTSICLRNAFHEELASVSDKGEVVLITLTRPIMCIQPLAVDRAVLFWLNYKNAYEYWNEQRSSLNKEVITATQQLFEKVPQLSSAANIKSNLFLQLTVSDIGLCLPLNPCRSVSRYFDSAETRDALVVTLESTIISACNSGSLVCKANFTGFCLRFAPEFETSLDDWKPNFEDPQIMNWCRVSKGTYDVCSRTLVQTVEENAKWLLNVQWEMEGVVLHLDVNIGKYLSSLARTLTMLTSAPDSIGVPMTDLDSDEVDSGDHTPQEPATLPSFIFDPNMDARQRAKLLEIEMNEQAKTVNDLKSLGASSATIEQEIRRLRELEKIVSNDFRRDMLMKIRRQSIKASSMKDRLGLGHKLQLRSKSFKVPSPTFEVREPIMRHASIASGSTDSNPMEDGEPDVFLEPKKPNTPCMSPLTRHEGFHKTGDSSNTSSDNKSPPSYPDRVSGSQAPISSKQRDPMIDLELDVRVSIKCGECILFNRSVKDEDNKRMKKERSFSGGIYEVPTSPSSGRKKPEFRQGSTSKLKHTGQPNITYAMDSTELSIPGLDVKVYYESHNIHDETPNNEPDQKPSNASKPSETRPNNIPLRPTALPPFNTTTNPRPGLKRASLFTWMTLQSIAEETIISPSILDFMEKVLQPIPLNEFAGHGISSPESEEQGLFNVDLDSTLNNSYSYASFPVDVIVYFHMQPSAIRFSCQPVSRVECLLKLPSLNVVFSSKRADERRNINDGDESPIARGGLSVTGALEDFSLFVFHPYGGKQRAPNTPYVALAESDRKDSLSVVVEFIKFHISRSRKINFKTDVFNKKSSTPKAVVRFSSIIDIGKALFKYDMRRLQEILAFPRAWYRRTIVRRLFLGDITSRSTTAKDTKSANNESPHQHEKLSATSSDEKNGRPLTPNSEKNKRTKVGFSTDTRNHSPKLNDSPEQTQKSGSWETLVQFAVNFNELNVQMNMGNVMGNVVWTTKDFQSNVRLSIGSSGHKNMYIGFGLGGSCLEAKGGIVGGTIELADINVYFKIQEDPHTEPDHVVGLKLFAMQSKLDYMGTSVLMGRVSSFSVTLKDEWKLKQCALDEEDTTRRGATIFIIGDLEWDQLQMLISKSTTADLLKMHHKLEEFFTQQFNSSKRVFSSLQTRTKSSVKHKDRSKEPVKKLSNGIAPVQATDPRHHRHWQNVLEKVSGLRLTTLPKPLPKIGTVLGGSLELHGKNIFLACFHGINFRSKSWAIFSLKEPYINFTTEAQDVTEKDAQDTHIMQNLTFSLGVMKKTHAQHVSMAKVCRIARTTVFPPQFKTLQDWFLYAFCTSDLDDVNRFPCLDTNRTDSLTSSSSTENKRARSQEHSHTSETIFAFPSMEIHLSTKHLQPSVPPDITDMRPLVECSFFTEFNDHIFVAVDAENFFFLHDLINSYIKDTKDKMAPKARTYTTDDSKDGEKVSKVVKVNEPTQILQQDWRDFSCVTWHLEPTVRLLSWAARNLEPYGVDYILNKLGFRHARTTIPKWLQRGCMDPLDKVLSVLMFRIIAAIHEHDSANK